MRMKNLIPWRDKRIASLDREFPLSQIQRDMNRLFDEVWTDFEFPMTKRNGYDFSPQLDVIETEDSMVVKIELPGISAEDVEVTVANDLLLIKGEKRSEHEEKEDNFYRMERSFGSFARSVPLPAGLINEEKVRALFENGILTVTLDKLPEAKVVEKKVTIQTA